MSSTCHQPRLIDLLAPVPDSQRGEAEASLISPGDLAELIASFSEVTSRLEATHDQLRGEVARLNTDTQHNAYVLLPGETDAPAGLKQALANANAMQDFAMDEIRPGRTGNEILGSVLTRMKAKGIGGTMYTHPIGMNGHGAGLLIGLWDYQDGVVGRGEAKVSPSMWFSIELQATTPVAEWGGQPVQMAQEEHMIVGADGKTRWARRRQDRLFLVRSGR